METQTIMFIQLRFLTSLNRLFWNMLTPLEKLIHHISISSNFEKRSIIGVWKVQNTPLKIFFFKMDNNEQYCWIPANLGINL